MRKDGKADVKKKPDPDHGRKGKNDNWPGCTEEFVNKTKKRRAKNKAAKKSKQRNRK